MIKNFFGLFLIIFVALFFGNICLASTFYLEEKNISVLENEDFFLDIIIDSENSKSFTLSAGIFYPVSFLEINSFSFSLGWIRAMGDEYDLIDNENGILIKTAGWPSGILEKKVFGTINFKAKKEGEVSIERKKDSFVLDEENNNIIYFDNNDDIKIKIVKNSDFIQYINDEAKIIITGDVNLILDKLKQKRSLEKERNSFLYINRLFGGLEEKEQYIFNNFIAYGTDSTLRLGEGERTGVLNSYKKTFSKLPKTTEEWSDLLKIANGRWPNERNIEVEEEANVDFERVYLRKSDRSNPYDDAAIVIMSYGLRLKTRNLESEKTAIIIFKDIYGFYPVDALAWDIVRAIAYSGAIR